MYDGDIHYATTPMQYTTILHGCKNVDFQIKSFNIFLTFAQNSDCGYTVSSSTHNLCFGAKNKKCKPQFYCIKVVCKGFFTTQTCLHDVYKILISYD